MIIVTGQCAMLCGALACMVLLVSMTSLLENSAVHPKYTRFVAHAFFFRPGKNPKEPKLAALKSLVTKNAYSENCISWIFGQLFENVHE